MQKLLTVKNNTVFLSIAYNQMTKLKLLNNHFNPSTLNYRHGLIKIYQL